MTVEQFAWDWKTPTGRWQLLLREERHGDLLARTAYLITPPHRTADGTRVYEFHAMYFSAAALAAVLDHAIVDWALASPFQQEVASA